MIAKAWRIAKEYYPSPEGISAFHSWLPWRDIEGQWRLGPVTWEDVFAHRDSFAHRSYNDLARCSCGSCCGNPRRFFGERTLQERRSDNAFEAQLAEIRENHS
jgi:hypothetical protein